MIPKRKFFCCLYGIYLLSNGDLSGINNAVDEFGAKVVKRKVEELARKGYVKYIEGKPFPTRKGMSILKRNGWLSGSKM